MSQTSVALLSDRSQYVSMHVRTLARIVAVVARVVGEDVAAMSGVTAARVDDAGHCTVRKTPKQYAWHALANRRVTSAGSHTSSRPATSSPLQNDSMQLRAASLLLLLPAVGVVTLV